MHTFFRYFSIFFLMLFSVSCTGKERTDANDKEDSLSQNIQQQDLKKTAIFYASVAKHVHDTYVEKTTYNELLEGSLNGMLTSLDPHSAYLDKKQYKELRNATMGEFGGLGIEVTMEDGLIKIISPMEDAPAYKAGLLPGDLIIRIGDEPVYGMSMIQAVDKLKGKPGTKVTFTVRRQGKPDFEVTLARAIIQVKPVKVKIENNIGVIRIITFSEDTTKGVIRAVNEIKKKLGSKLDGVILDLRNDAGGLFDQAVSVSNLFLKSGGIVTIKARTGKDPVQHFNANSSDVLEGVPMAVLINAGTASASEIVAGALQDQKRAIVVGTKSFGKGSVQTVIPLSNGGALKLTTALYYTPNGRSIQKLGIEPDIVVEQALGLKMVNDGHQLRESDFQRAIPNGNNKTQSKVQRQDILAQAEEQKNKEPVDYQLIRAEDILKGIHFYEATKMR